MDTFWIYFVFRYFSLIVFRLCFSWHPALVIRQVPLLGGVWETNVAHSRILDTPPPDLHNAHTVHYSVKAHLSSEVGKKSKEKRSPPNQRVSGPTLPTLPHIY